MQEIFAIQDYTDYYHELIKDSREDLPEVAFLGIIANQNFFRIYAVKEYPNFAEILYKDVLPKVSYDPKRIVKIHVNTGAYYEEQHVEETLPLAMKYITLDGLIRIKKGL